MRLGILHFLFVFCFLCAPARAEAPVFFMSLQDVPVMPGLEELPDLTVTFDKPAGRIIESMAVIDGVTAQDIEAYYEATLPQFGWKKVAPYSYVRENENLQIGFETIEAQEFLKLTIVPR